MRLMTPRRRRWPRWLAAVAVAAAVATALPAGPAATARTQAATPHAATPHAAHPAGPVADDGARVVAGHDPLVVERFGHPADPPNVITISP